MLTPTQIEKRQAGAEFAKRAFRRSDATRDETAGQRFDRLWRESAAFGLPGIAIPSEFGGLGEDLLDVVSLMEGIGTQSEEAGIMFSLNAHIWACTMPLNLFGTPAQKTRWLPKLASGEVIGAHAISEPESGSDAFSLTTSYQREPDGFRLTGGKVFVTNGPKAGLILVFARHPGTEQMKGLSCFLVEPGPGLVVGRPEPKMGLELSPLSSLYFNDCPVPEDCLLGKEGEAATIFHAIMEYERPFILAFQVGMMEQQLKRSVEYARRRKQSGSRIINFQSVSNRLADMKVRLEASRLLVYEAARQKKANQPSFLSSSIAKLFVSESLVANGLAAMRTFGSYGYMREYGVERELRDSIGSLFYSGTSDVQRNLIASLL